MKAIIYFNLFFFFTVTLADDNYENERLMEFERSSRGNDYWLRAACEKRLLDSYIIGCPSSFPKMPVQNYMLFDTISEPSDKYTLCDKSLSFCRDVNTSQSEAYEEPIEILDFFIRDKKNYIVNKMNIKDFKFKVYKLRKDFRVCFENGALVNKAEQCSLFDGIVDLNQCEKPTITSDGILCANGEKIQISNISRDLGKGEGRKTSSEVKRREGSSSQQQ